MNEEIKRGCGIDIDPQTLWVTIFITSLWGRTTNATRDFDNTIPGIEDLKKWLKKKRITHVVFESTGFYWQMLYSMLENSFTIYVANPRHTKQLKGKKTDRLDSKTLATILRNGAIQPSFILPHEFRELRDLTRQYQNLIHDRVRVMNRINQTLWNASIPLKQCMSKLFGVSGRAMIEALIKGLPGPEIAQLARGKLRRNIPKLEVALRFPLSKHYRKILVFYWKQYLFLSKTIGQLEKEINRRMKPYNTLVARLCTLPGVGTKLAQAILSEIGDDMSRFPSARHFASWAKLCPGNNSSAGKRKSGKNSKGNKYVQSYLVEAAWAAVRKKNCGLRDLYYRRCARLGKKKAIVSVAHKLSRIIYTMLSNEVTYDEAYESNRRPKFHGFVIHDKLRKYNDEDLVSELLSRGARSIIWHHEDDDDADDTFAPSFITS